MKFDIISIFPEFFESPLSCGILRIAREKKALDVHVTNPRDFTRDRIVDDYCFGGGAGMVMKPEPLIKAVQHVIRPDSTVIHLTPKGRCLTQPMVHSLAEKSHMVIICGRYKGIDERVQHAFKPMKISIGDYILSGGEIAALVLVESITRLVPGVIGNQDSAYSDSFENALLEAPLYTRPARYRRMTVPSVLRSGDHRRIARWRRKKSLQETLVNRNDLLPGTTFSRDDLALMMEVLNGKHA